MTPVGLGWVVADLAAAGVIPAFWLAAVAGTAAPLDGATAAFPIGDDAELGLPSVAFMGVQGAALAVLVVAGAELFLLPNIDLRLDSVA